MFHGLTSTLLGPVTRIILRVIAGILIGRGWLSPEDGALLSSDPDLALLIEGAVGAVILSATEYFYYLAKRWGWAT